MVSGFSRRAVGGKERSRGGWGDEVEEIERLRYRGFAVEER